MKNLYSIKHKLLHLEGVWGDVLGEPETSGAWLIWGTDKNGKTWLALLLADYLSTINKVLYISGEEGISSNFKNTCQRAKISPNNSQLKVCAYEPIPELYKRLKSRRSAPRVVIIDNITIYNDELKNGVLRSLLLDFPQTLFIFLAHEERNEPYTATAKLARRLAKVIFRVEGLACKVSGRCPGGVLVIDEERAELYHGHKFKEAGSWE